jgi:peptidyl-prolyl cis-trans isomerase A (cyclophilin A)
MRTWILALAALAASPVSAQDAAAPAPSAPPAPAAPAPKAATVKVTLTTSAGPIVLELEKDRAPITTANFLKYVDGKKLDGEAIYRASKVAPGYGLIQGGIRGDARKLLPPIKHEPTTQTGLSNVDGAIAMARAAPGSAQSDFFIMIGDMKALDADPAAAGDNLGFATFGRVIEGMEIVRKILDFPTSPTLGEGVMKGQMLEPVVKIVTARRAS